MSKLYRGMSVFVLLVAVSFLMSIDGCERTFVTFGGKIIHDGTKSTFSGNADSCSDDENGEPWVQGNLVYHSGIEKGVRIKGHVTGAANCDGKGDLFDLKCIVCELFEAFIDHDNDNDSNVLLLEFDYRSQNPKNKGEGRGFACLIDNGEGNSASADVAGIALTHGPFEGYVNVGEVQGNVQEHGCDEEED